MGVKHGPHHTPPSRLAGGAVYWHTPHCVTQTCFGVVPMISISPDLAVRGLACWHWGLVCVQTWHWNEKRYIAQFYSDLSKREAREEVERQKDIQAKYKALEEELLS